MHRIDGEGNVSGKFVDVDVSTGTMGTEVTADFMNAAQEELVNAIEDGGQTLNKADNAQLKTALRATYGAKGTANTWTAKQTLSAGADVTGAVAITGALTAGTTTVNGTGSNIGLTVTGGPSSGGAGLKATGGATFAFGVTGKGGPSGYGVIGEPGTAATATTPQYALGADRGYLQFLNVVNPNSNVGFTNAQTPMNTPKAWGTISVNTGTATVTDGFNVGSVSISGNSVVVNFAGAMADGNYAVTGGQVISSVSTANAGVGFHSRAAGSFQLIAFNPSNTVLAPGSSVFTVMFTVFGRQ